MNVVVYVVVLAAFVYGSWVLTGPLAVRLVTWMQERRAREARADELIRRYLPQVVDPVDSRFEEARSSLLEPIPATPLCAPALRHWKEIEADLCSDPEFIPAVDAALRDSDQT